MLILPLAAQQSSGGMQCPVVKVGAERLADLNVPRCAHSVLLLNGEPTAIGGHTTNFVPTPTLEYYKDGKWHLMPTAFSHDDGLAIELATGKVLIAGGHSGNLGVGQSFEAELYDPSTRTSEGFASLDTKRALASALALDDGRVVIAGNWHHDDAIEIYDGKTGFLPVKGVSIGRCTPCILQTAKDDAIIIGGRDTLGRQITMPVADRLQGEPCHVPLLEQWSIRPGFMLWPSSTAFIGDKSKGDYSYLLPVSNDEGQHAIARVTNGEFSLLATDVPIPESSQWGEICYIISFLVDRQRQRAYFIGCDSSFVSPCDSTHVYVVAIDYAHTPARLTFYYTDVLTDVDITFPLLNADGDLMLIGGAPKSSFFKPTAATWLIHISPCTRAATADLPLWSWLLVISALIALAAWLVLRARHRKRNQEETPIMFSEEEHVTDQDIHGAEDLVATDDVLAELMHRMCQLMEEERLYLNPALKVSDIANAVGISRIAVSNCIKSQKGSTFPQFINDYRVAHAKEMLRNQPDAKIAEVWMASGFSSEASFYRIFKTVTGTTPTDWKNNSKF